MMGVCVSAILPSQPSTLTPQFPSQSPLLSRPKFLQIAGEITYSLSCEETGSVGRRVGLALVGRSVGNIAFNKTGIVALVRFGCCAVCPDTVSEGWSPYRIAESRN